MSSFWPWLIAVGKGIKCCKLVAIKLPDTHRGGEEGEEPSM